MARLIERVVKKPLSEKLLFGDLANGGVVRVHVENDAIALDVAR
jgi:ATP-dependent Clp protease ATP-binding subunit ClpA